MAVIWVAKMNKCTSLTVKLCQMHYCCFLMPHCLNLSGLVFFFFFPRFKTKYSLLLEKLKFPRWITKINAHWISQYLFWVLLKCVPCYYYYYYLFIYFQKWYLKILMPLLCEIKWKFNLSSTWAVFEYFSSQIENSLHFLFERINHV